jgi:hypothetical protein
MDDCKVRPIAFYLPQYYPIPENNEWWGKGFTEWTNVAKAKPLFPGHYQPHLPADLGFYDLRLPEVREAQAAMARGYGIEGFCYYHYWFGGGRRLLDRPFSEVLSSGEPEFPFCLCWANESWSGIWHGCPNRILMKQEYPGEADERAHFEFLLSAFTDKRYITVDGKPLVVIYSPRELPEPRRLTDHWRKLAADAGLKGLFLVGMENEPWKPADNGFDGATVRNLVNMHRGLGKIKQPRHLRLWRRLQGQPRRTYRYADALPHLFMPEAAKPEVFPCVVPNWDNTPRSGLQGVVLHGSTPELFRQHVRRTVEQVLPKPPEKRVIFLKSWNEWAEGNHLEPDQRFDHSYLQVLKAELDHAGKALPGSQTAPITEQQQRAVIFSDAIG